MNSNTVPVVPGMRWSDVDQKALHTVKQLLFSPHNLLQPEAMFGIFQDGTLEKLGLGYGVEELPVGEEGKYDPSKNEVILDIQTYHKLAIDDPRARFTFAHEIGHGILHGPYLQEALSGRASCKQCKRSQLPAYADPECQANRFAASFLMPSGLFMKCYREGMSVSRLAQTFRTSEDATRIRLQTLTK